MIKLFGWLALAAAFALAVGGAAWGLAWPDKAHGWWIQRRPGLEF